MIPNYRCGQSLLVYHYDKLLLNWARDLGVLHFFQNIQYTWLIDPTHFHNYGDNIIAIL